jgi:hypothetical protein
MKYLNGSRRDSSGTDFALLPDVGEAQAADMRAKAQSLPSTIGIWTRSVIVGTAVWSVIELPFEVWDSVSRRDAIACIIAKMLWLALAGFVLVGNRVARTAYSLFCAIGLTAVVFALPTEFRVFPLGFGISFVECTLKATAFACLVSAGFYE